MNEDLCLHSIEDVASLIAKRELSPVELTEMMLSRIERLDPQLNSYITVMTEQSIAQARTADREIAAGNYRGVLHGIPIAHKDLYQTKGIGTTAGMKVLGDWIPGDDATVVTKWAGAGVICLGKLNMHEAAFGTTSDNIHYGAVHNPWNLDHIPGGSSGGSGAATAAGLAFATTGSDTGGSIRIPASECGCVGMMPTYGRASLHNIFPLSWTLDHPGPLARTVRDAAIALQAMSGYDPRDPASEDHAVPDMLDGIEAGPKGLRIGVPKQHLWDKINPEFESLVRAAIEALEAAGAEVREIDAPRLTEWSRLIGPIIVVEAAVVHAAYYPSRKDEYASPVAGSIGAGPAVPVTAYAAAMRSLREARAGAADAMLDGVDVLAFPTMPEPPPTIAETRTGENATRRTVNTSLWDVTGQPVISVPCGLTAAGFPVGLSLAARRWDEATLLRAARAYELFRGPFPAPPIAL